MSHRVDSIYDLIKATDNLNKLKLIESILFKQRDNNNTRMQSLLGISYWSARYILNKKIKKIEHNLNQ